jgi:hypothetical protein
MDPKNLELGEAIAVVGGLVLTLSLFLEWFTLGNHNATLNGCKGPNGSCTGWSSLTILRYFLLLAAIAPVVLAWIIMRGHALSWPRGELTAVAAISALTFIIFRGLIDKPGNPPGQISISYGWFVALLGAILILVGALTRTREAGERKRKPPGVL